MKKILFTGARSGISFKVINKLLDKNYYIYVTVHTEKQLESVSRYYQSYSNVKCFKLDITDNNDIQQLNNLDIDILVNNAAIGNGGAICEIPFNKVKEIFDVNIIGTINVIQTVYKNMYKKNDGKIIIISSLSGLIPINFLGTYAATKAGLIKIAQTLRNELKLIDNSTKVKLIEPGFYYTGFNQVMFDNKYEFMNNDTYFNSIIESIKRKESLIHTFIEKKNLNSIVKKILSAIENDNNKFIYRAPISQVIFAKIYDIFKN